LAPGGCPVVDGCGSLSSGDCPVEAGETIIYDIEMKIELLYPAVSFPLSVDNVCGSKRKNGLRHR
jgi:hypothetical protein